MRSTHSNLVQARFLDTGHCDRCKEKELGRAAIASFSICGGSMVPATGASRCISVYQESHGVGWFLVPSSEWM